MQLSLKGGLPSWAEGSVGSCSWQGRAEPWVNPAWLFAAFLGPHPHRECRSTDHPACSEQFLWTRLFFPPWSWYLDTPAKLLVKGRPLCRYLLNVDWSARPADQKGAGRQGVCSLEDLSWFLGLPLTDMWGWTNPSTPASLS